MTYRPRAKLVYLASPYSSPAAQIREIRFNMITEIAADIVRRCPDVALFAPITQSHPMAAYLQESTNNADFWLPIDMTLLLRCDELWVAELPGWQDSVGVRAEIALAEKLGIPICSADQGIRACSVGSGR